MVVAATGAGRVGLVRVCGLALGLRISTIFHVDGSFVGSPLGRVGRGLGAFRYAIEPYYPIPPPGVAMACRGWRASFRSMIIDREGPVPPYRQIADHLRRQIEDGTIPPGRRIPSIVEMEQTYNVARDTLRKATRLLKEEGLVETVQGMGLYVVDRQPPAENA